MDKEAYVRLLRWAGAAALAMAAATGMDPAAKAAPMYTIKDLGTLPGTTMSVATSINNAGQVVGVSYNPSEGMFVQNFPYSANPPRFVQNNGTGGQSFLYSNGQMAPINPTGGLALSINDSGQVVGGQFTSINASGQYVGGPSAGTGSADLATNNPALTGLVYGGSGAPSHAEMVSGATVTPLGLVPYAINNAGLIAGSVGTGNMGFDPAISQGGKVANIGLILTVGQLPGNGNAIALNQKGDVLVTLYEGPKNESLIYSTTKGQVLVNITSLQGGLGLVGAALNDKNQVVGNGFLYNNGTLQALTSLIPPVSGWSNLNATGINDQGQIVGQGMINGQGHAFLMTPDSNQVPEPGALAVWAMVGAGAFFMARRRMG